MNRQQLSQYLARLAQLESELARFGSFEFRLKHYAAAVAYQRIQWALEANSLRPLFVTARALKQCIQDRRAILAARAARRKEKEAMRQARQGDVLIRRVDKVPEGARKVAPVNGRFILAEGEATGHAHAVLERDANLFEIDDVDARFLEVLADSQLLHEEHDTIDLPPGVYEIGRQREYSPEEIRVVAD